MSSKKPDHFTADRVRLLTAIADGLGVLLENARLQEETETRALEVERLSEFNTQIIDSTPAALAVVRGSERVLVSANRSYRKTFANGAISIEGRPITETLAVDGLDHIMRECVERGHVTENETPFVNPHGEERWFDISAVTLRPNAEEFLLVLNEVTEKKRQREKVMETARLLSVGEPATGVAHEVNNPLAVVVGFSEVLMDHDLPQPASDHVERIHLEAKRAARIVQNLLSFARKHEPSKQYLDPADVLEEALDLKIQDLRVGNILVTHQRARDLPRTLADKHQLLQVFLNIITNAEHAMLSFRGDGSLALSTNGSKDWIRISIADDGPGIPAENLPRIFDPFFTAKEIGQGTGLGLSICHGIVSQHGGEIWAESRMGEGTTFHVQLPVLPPEVEPECEPRELVANATTESRVLVVDDEPGVRALLSHTLSGDGHTVETASGGQQALDLIKEGEYDCIIADLKMPGMSGQELYRRLAALDPMLPNKVIFVTGDTVRRDARDFLEKTRSPAVAKLFDLSELRRKIQDLTAAARDRANGFDDSERRGSEVDHR